MLSASVRRSAVRTNISTCTTKCIITKSSFSTLHSSYSSLLQIHPRVAQALHENKPIVALESTIISHGMPYPENVETALEVEKCVEKHGSIPATIALIKGKICIGLESDALELLGKTGSKARKVSRRDFASTLISTTTLGATTVAGTMIAANMANIRLFVTGGIGGVHRGAETTFDISADLIELSQTPVSVICAGIKSILDIPKTLEYLETHGVPVISYNTDEFPAFFSTKSGIRTPERMNTIKEIAELVYMSKDILNLQNGNVIAIPNPAPTVGADIEQAIHTAIQELEQQKISGKDATPFLLSRIAQLTKGNSLQSNVTLIKHNAEIGSKIAVEYSKLKQQNYLGKKSIFSGTNSTTNKRYFSTSTKPLFAQNQIPSTTYDNNVLIKGRPVVIGGAVIDVLCRPLPNKKLELHTSNPGKITYSYGGVGKNIAEVIGRLSGSSGSEIDISPIFITALDTKNNATNTDNATLNNTSPGSGIATYCQNHNIQLYSVTTDSSSLSTATYMAILDHQGELVTAVADMQIFDQITPSALKSLGIHDILSQHTSFVVCDANIPVETLQYIGKYLTSSPSVAKVNIPFLFEPISTTKCLKIIEANVLHLTTVLKPNRYEIISLANEIRKKLKLPPIEKLTTRNQTNNNDSSLPNNHNTMKTVKEKHKEGIIFKEAYTFNQEEYKRTGSTWIRDPSLSSSTSIKKTKSMDNTTNQNINENEEEDDDVLTDELLIAAQTVFAAMVRPYDLNVPLSTGALNIAWKGLYTPEGIQEIQKIVPEFGKDISVSKDDNHPTDNSSSPSPTNINYPQPCNGGVIESRKHLIITLGKYGVLWLSGKPFSQSPIELEILNKLSSSAASSSKNKDGLLPSDLLFVLPFFSASNHPAINFDFKLCHATPIDPSSITKVTGAGDTLVGSLVWSLCEGANMAQAIQIGIAGASLAIQGKPSDGAIPSTLTVEALQQRTQETPPIDAEYA